MARSRPAFLELRHVVVEETDIQRFMYGWLQGIVVINQISSRLPFTATGVRMVLLGTT